MLPVAHMGITFTAVRAIEKRGLMEWLDYRVLLVASLLPDLLDKPVAYWAFDRPLGFGARTFGHSLAFLLLIGCLWLICRIWRNGSIPAALFIGTVFHDILDVMWFNPEVFLWPLYGWKFPDKTLTVWSGFFEFAGLKMRQLDALDTIGAFFLLYFFARLAFNGKIIVFLRTGKLRY